MIEEKLGLESYFEKERFGQREDGFYCLKAPTKVKFVIENCVKNFLTNFTQGQKTILYAEFQGSYRARQEENVRRNK